MKKLMILGAGIYQVPLIKQAKKMGIYTIVVSVRGNYPGFAYADKICYEDTRNAQAIVKIAEQENIDGILTTGTDVAVVTIGKVCDTLGLTGLSLEAAAIATDKMRMRAHQTDCIGQFLFRADFDNPSASGCINGFYYDRHPQAPHTFFQISILEKHLTILRRPGELSGICVCGQDLL